MAVRREVAFCEAVWDGHQVVQGVDALLIHMADDISPVWDQGKIPVLVDPDNLSRHEVKPDVVVDAILAKKNMGTALNNAPLVIALGPGFEAGIDAHFVIEKPVYCGEFGKKFTEQQLTLLNKCKPETVYIQTGTIFVLIE